MSDQLDLRDLIRNPERYMVDGEHLLSAKLELQTRSGSVFVHRYDHSLQEQRVTRIDGVLGTAPTLREALRELVADIEASNDVEFTGSLLRAKDALHAAGVGGRDGA